jgi:hypothetical protein
VTTGKETVVLLEHLGKRRRRLIANAGRNPGDGYVKVFPKHVAAMRGAGCQTVMQEPAQLAQDNAATCHHSLE